MSRQPKLNLRSIVAASVSSSLPREAEIVRFEAVARASANGKPTLKERAKQLSVYLEPPVYDQLRDLAYTERTKIHPLMLEALDLLFKQRGALSIQDLELRAAERQ